MTNPSQRTKVFLATPPDKGSFPLDHDKECHNEMVKYMKCLADNRNDNSKCRESSREYLACRMDKGLMAREEWKNLGFDDNNDKKK